MIEFLRASERWFTRITIAIIVLLAADQAFATFSGNGPFLNQILDGVGGVNKAQVTAANALKVDGSAITQPISIAGVVSVTGGAQQGATATSGLVNLVAGVGSGNYTANIVCDNTVPYDTSVSGLSQLVALSSGKTIYLCGYAFFSNGVVNVELDYGTGSTCGTGNNKIVPAYMLTSQTGIVDSSTVYRGLHTAASNALCIRTSAAVSVQGIVYYTQF